MSNKFQIGGSLTSESSLYVNRQADTDLISSLKNNELCYIFNTRQIGKSSLLLKTKNHMQTIGYRCAYIDISRIGSINISVNQWYAGLAFEIWRSLSLPTGKHFFDWWKNLGDIPSPQKLFFLWNDYLLTIFKNESFIIFFDEIDSVLSLPFAADDFFSVIRSSYNTEQNKQNFGRMNFALFGVALPSDLIKDNSSAPFNIGKAIQLDCFTLNESFPLIAPFNFTDSQKKRVLTRVLYWTGGQPFLTQKFLSILFSQVKKLNLIKIDETNIDCIAQQRFIDNWRNQDNPEHLKTIYDRITLDNEHCIQLLSDYFKVLTGTHTPESISNYQRLYLTGLVHIIDEKIKVKSNLYKAIFSQSWTENELAKLRPYHTKMQLWLIHKKDEYLLPEAALNSAKNWSQSRSLSENDYLYLANCQDKLNQAVKRENKQLNIEVIQRRKTETKLQNTLIELDKAKLDAESANKAKSHFLTKVSHEIRTHVNNIIGINFLATKQKEPTEQLKRIARVARYMQSIINDLVDINQIERGELAFKQETFYLDSVIDNLVDINGPIIYEKGLDFSIEMPNKLTPLIISDPHRIEQVLSNLLANAIKYCSIGSISITIKFEDDIEQEGRVHLNLTVTDTGAGFTQKPFKGIISTSSDSFVKVGIGLSICCELLNILGSKLTVESKPKQGSKLSFRLCLNTNKEPESLNYDISTLPIIGIPSTLDKETIRTLNILNCEFYEYDINSVHFERNNINVFLIDECFQQYQHQLLTLHEENKQIVLIPILTIGYNSPTFLQNLNSYNRIDLPITPRKLFNELQSYQIGNTIDEFDLRLLNHSKLYQVLVAEDDEINQEIIHSLLSIMGLNVTIVDNGQKAINSILAEDFDLILMDIEMPIMNGLDAVKVIRNNSKTSENKRLNNIPIIAMTAHALLGDKEKFICAGMNDHISKPIEPQNLYNALRQWLPQISTVELNETKTLFPDIEGVNTYEGLLRCNNNISLFCKVLSQFYQKYQSLITKTINKKENLRLCMHAIKGTAGNIGANNISKSAALLESHLIIGDSIPDSELVNFDNNLNLLCCNIEQALNDFNGKGMIDDNTCNQKQLNLVLALQLHKALSEDHSQALEICEQLKNNKDKVSIELYHLINNFEIDQASQLLSSWSADQINSSSKEA